MNGVQATQEFLQKIVDILIDYIKEQNDRNTKVLDFHHPEKMKGLLDLEVPEQAINLQQLVKDCAVTLKYQVRTGQPPFYLKLTNYWYFDFSVFMKICCNQGVNVVPSDFVVSDLWIFYKFKCTPKKTFLVFLY